MINTTGAGGTSLALERRQRDPQFAERFFVGHAIDIGAGPDGLGRQGWPNLRSVWEWDQANGDATLMAGVERQFDLVYSSHCLEHINEPFKALARWWKLVRPGGHLVLVVPDEDLYEQGVFPSIANSGHKNTWTLFKPVSWSPASINLLPLLFVLPFARIVRAEWLERGFDYAIPRTDQTATAACESCIEVIVRKELA